MRNRKMVMSTCESCGKQIHDYRRLVECYSCGVARWEKFDGVQRAPDYCTVVSLEK